MELRKLLYTFSLSVVCGAFAACSNIAEDDRFIEFDPVVNDSVSGDSLKVVKNVLIEDFTGQQCMNCPNATVAIEQMQERYGADRVIAVALHSGPFGVGTPLRTDDGDWYYGHWGVSGQPTGYIDRRDMSSITTEWNTLVYQALQREATLALTASCNYATATRNVDITVEAKGVSSVDGNLQVWLLEDSIVSPQLLTDGKTYDYNYVHNHVFRATVNDRMGDAITVGADETETRTFTYQISNDWKPENMAVVAFVYNDSGVMQVVKASLIPKTDGSEDNTVADE